MAARATAAVKHEGWSIRHQENGRRFIEVLNVCFWHLADMRAVEPHDRF